MSRHEPKRFWRKVVRRKVTPGERAGSSSIILELACGHATKRFGSHVGKGIQANCETCEAEAEAKAKR